MNVTASRPSADPSAKTVPPFPRKYGATGSLSKQAHMATLSMIAQTHMAVLLPTCAMAAASVIIPDAGSANNVHNIALIM